MIRVYITPFDDSGNFSDEIEVTSDVDKDAIGKIKRSLDNSTYDIGVLRYNNLKLRLQNWHGKYSDISNLKSIFRFRRSGSKVRVTWAPAEFAICGVAVCGEVILSEEVTIYRGILNDEATKMDLNNQIIQFDVLSYDSLFSKLIVPYASLEVSDTLKDILIKTLSQFLVTKYMSVEEENINLQVDFVPDDLTWFENKTAKEAIEKILLISNSVLFVDQEVVYAKGRSPSVDVKKSFFGQASGLGNENISNILNFRNGQNRIINFVRWKDSSTAQLNGDSVQRWGAFVKEIEAEFVTDPTKQQQTAQAIVQEFKDPKMEMSLEALLDASTVELNFLDKVDIDYPTVIFPVGKYLPIVGVTKIGDEDSPLPGKLWDFSINQDKKFKIMGIDIDPKLEITSFQLREV